MAETRSNLLAGKYRVESSLGRGGMAEVYRVWDPDRRASVAMKVLHEFLADDPVFLARFQREARNLAKLEHPNIVRFFEFAHVGDLAFMLMEYIDGTTLSRVRKRLEKPFTPGQILWIMQPVCAALHFAHGKGLIHCDIKSGNIMLDKNGKILLADFGIARSTDAATVTTMAGAGTPAYMSPEQIIGADPSPLMDVYALGVVMYELATGGKLPFTGERTTAKGTNAEKIRWEKRNLPPPPPRQYNPGISPQLEAVIMRCLQIEPARRYKSVTALLEALAEAVGVPPEPMAAAMLVRAEQASDALAAGQGRGLRIPRWAYAAGAVVALGIIGVLGITGMFAYRAATRPQPTIPPDALTPLVITATPGPVTPTLPPAPTQPPQPTSPPVLPLTWELKRTSSGYLLIVTGGPLMLDRQYGPMASGSFVAASTGAFGAYVDNKGWVYIINLAEDHLQKPWKRVTITEFRIFSKDNPVDQDPEWELRLVADDNNTYRLYVNETLMGGDDVYEVPRAMIY